MSWFSKALVFTWNLENTFNSPWRSSLQENLFYLCYFVTVLIVLLLFLKLCNYRNGEQKLDISSFTSSWHLLWLISSALKENLSGIFYITYSIICSLNAIHFFQCRFKLFYYILIFSPSLSFFSFYLFNFLNFLFPFLRDHISMNFCKDKKLFFSKIVFWVL